MANTFGQSAWLIDTASATPIVAVSTILNITGFKWICDGTATAGAQVIVTDANGGPVWADEAQGPFWVSSTAESRWWSTTPLRISGLIVGTLVSGSKLWIYRR